MADHTQRSSMAQAMALQKRELEREQHNDLATQYASALGAMTAHLADMYHRFGVPESHQELTSPTCPDH